MARVVDRKVYGRVVIRDKNGNPVFSGTMSELSYTESRDCVPSIRGDLGSERSEYGQLDVDIKMDQFTMVPSGSVHLLQTPVDSNASIWQRIEELEALYKSNELSYSAFCAKRRTLLAKLQGPVNPRHLEGAAAIFDESSEIPEDRVHRIRVPSDAQVLKNLSLKSLLFAQFYGGDPLKAWRQAETVILKSNVAGFVGSFDEVTPGGAHRKNYVFDLEDSW